jgi:hypothetical protein
MTSQTSCPRDLSDRDLLSEVERAAKCERQATARLIALLMEVDSRKLYVGQGYSSLFTYCVQRLHLSEHAAYLRIEAARSAQRFPVILEKLSDGSVHLSAVSLLRPHLSQRNHVELLAAATHKSKREVEQLLGQWRPQPDVPTVIRKLPTPTPIPVRSSEFPVQVSVQETLCVNEPSELVLTPAAPASVAMRPPEIKPLAPERYKVQFTVSHETHAKLRRVQDLMRHAIPDGDPAAIFDRALTVLLADLLKVKCGATEHPRNGRPAQSRSRHIPAAVKRDVWHRDGGCCAFQGEQGRCTETGFLEFHHVVPYAERGAATASNLELRCRAHNQYEAELWFGASSMPAARESHAIYGT